MYVNVFVYVTLNCVNAHFYGINSALVLSSQCKDGINDNISKTSTVYILK